ncbi:MAG: transcriptional repressor [Deltaproteobacteria bacterium]|nr:transcriptional repressor [Deltaproteobacteria bacterium]
MGTELDILKQYLKRQDMRYTREREAIVREVFSRHDHFTVDELHLALGQSGNRISRASIYRTMPILIGAGLVAEVFQEQGQTVYEHTYGHEHHCHLRCLTCGKVVEFSEPYLHEVESKLAQQHGFQVHGHRLEVRGVCPKCKEEAQNNQ